MISSQDQRALDIAAPSLKNTPNSLSKLLISAPELISIKVGAGAGNTDFIVPRDLIVTDVWSVKTKATGVGSAKTATLQNGSVAISSALDLATVVDTIARTTKVVSAAATLKAGDKLRVAVTATAQDASAIIYVLVQRV